MRVIVRGLISVNAGAEARGIAMAFEDRIAELLADRAGAGPSLMIGAIIINPMIGALPDILRSEDKGRSVTSQVNADFEAFMAKTESGRIGAMGSTLVECVKRIPKKRLASAQAALLIDAIKQACRDLGGHSGARIVSAKRP